MPPFPADDNGLEDTTMYELSTEKNNGHLQDNLIKTAVVEDTKSQENEENGVIVLTKSEKIARTAALYIVFLGACGLPLFGVGPCLLDLQLLTRSTTQQISWVFTARSLGALCGGFMTGALMDRMNVWLCMAVSTVVGSLCYVLAPLHGELWTFIVFMWMSGLAYGFYSTAINIECTHIWGAKQGPYMQGLHMTGTIGGVISPLIAKPFLSDKVPHVTSMEKSHENGADLLQEDMEISTSNVTDFYEVTTQMFSHGNSTMGEHVSPLSESYVQYFFVLIGCIGIASSLGFWIIFMKSDRKVFTKKVRKARDVNDPDPIRGKYLKVLILSIVFTFYLLLSIYGRGYPNYTMAFTVEYLGWSKLHGALLTSLYLGVYVLARVGGIFIIARVKPQTVIIADLVVSICATIPVVLAVKEHVSVYWICTLLYGLGNATIFAAGFPWLGQYFTLTGRIGSVPMIGGFVGDILGPPLVGYLFEYVTPMGFIYVSLAGGILCLILMIVLQILANRYEKVYGKNSEDLVLDVDEEKEDKDLMKENL